MNYRIPGFIFFLLAVLSLQFGACTAKKAAKTNVADGTWQLLITTPRGDRTPVVVIDGATGTYEGEAIDVKVDGPKVSFLAGQQAGSMGRMDFTFAGTIDGDSMSGTYTLVTGSLKGRSGVFTAKRVKR